MTEDMKYDKGDHYRNAMHESYEVASNDLPKVPSAPIQPLSPYEQYNVAAGQGKDPGPMRQWGIKDMTTGK